MVNLFFYRKFSLNFNLIKTFNESCSLSKAARISLIKNRFVKIKFIKPLRFVKRRTHGYSINSIVKFAVKNKISL